MTHPPNGSAPPGVAAPTMPAVPPHAPSPLPSQPGPVVSGPPPGQGPQAPGPARRTAWAEGVDRLRAGATTEPGRLRIIGAVLALLVVAFGAVTAWQMTDRSTAADDVLNRSQRLSADAAAVYRSLADANTAASTGFLVGGQEPADVRARYSRDIDTAADKLATAAANTEADSGSAAAISDLNRLLPKYTGLIERARANNRQGLPLGGAYLRYANKTMQEQMLPAAEKLYQGENEHLREDYHRATPYPWAAIALGVIALGALAWAQRRNYRRTHRVFNHGMLAATAAGTVVLLWLVVGHSVARAGLDDSYDHGVRSLNVLHDAQIASLKARGNENLTLVSRGAETKTVDGETQDLYDVDYRKQMKTLGGADGDTGLLGRAASLADDSAGKKPVTDAVARVKDWKARHQAARDKDDAGDYKGALAKVIGSSEDQPTGESFDQVDKALDKALQHEQLEFHQAAADGRGAMTGLPVGAAVLAVLAAAGAVLGIGRRLSEYR